MPVSQRDKDLRTSTGYPGEYEIPARNRQYQNQPGRPSEPEQVMYTPNDRQRDQARHIRGDYEHG